MTKRAWYFIAIVVLVLAGSGAIAFSQTDSQTRALAQDVNTPTATPNSAAYWDQVRAAEVAYDRGDFATALDLARQAAILNPEPSAAWEVYRQASVAAAADDYLSHLPPSRYRIDTQHFIENQVNGMDYFIIDVREPDEFAAGHIDGAVNIPLRELGHSLDRLPEGKTMPVLVYCHTQKRATHALVVLRELGYSNVSNLIGGWAAYQEWKAANPVLPTPGPTSTPEPEPPSC
jgi:rhodanese-related sulfurtransferase